LGAAFEEEENDDPKDAENATERDALTCAVLP
jgi:hypothetical protein